VSSSQTNYTHIQKDSKPAGSALAQWRLDYQKAILALFWMYQKRAARKEVMRLASNVQMAVSEVKSVSLRLFLLSKKELKMR